ncbi:hypothetical protein [Enterovibrio norvegicus]|uniref:hypothetical protein n=1 Tax=Enterovibrio norvegicus TaxID=188144 RepID=UPI0039AEB813
MVNKEWKESLDKLKMKFNFDDPGSELEAIRVLSSSSHRVVKELVVRSWIIIDLSWVRKLREAGATLAELLEFLKLQGVECSYSTVQR